MFAHASGRRAHEFLLTSDISQLLKGITSLSN